jgi:hypothetical protein
MSKRLNWTCDRCKTSTQVEFDAGLAKTPQDWTRLRRWRQVAGTTIEQDFDLCPACTVLVDVAIEGLKDED